MLSASYSAGLCGIDGFLVTVECNQKNNLEGFELVGLPDLAVREAHRLLPGEKEDFVYTLNFKF